MKIYTYLTIFLISLATAFAETEATDGEASSEGRYESASEWLREQPTLIAVYTKGLICRSCGIGIRNHMGQLENVDTMQFNKGVELDIRNQLVVVAINEGQEPDVEAIREAIYNAGYDPVHYYVSIGGTVTQIEFSGE